MQDNLTPRIAPMQARSNKSYQDVNYGTFEGKIDFSENPSIDKLLLTRAEKIVTGKCRGHYTSDQIKKAYQRLRDAGYEL